VGGKGGGEGVGSVLGGVTVGAWEGRNGSGGMDLGPQDVVRKCGVAVESRGGWRGVQSG